MSLDRQTIEKRDFPISRRGYETVAVDEHLARIAQELEQREQAVPAAAPVAPSLASNASEQVRAIVEAAEATASTIESQARSDADEARGSAADDARSTRETASAEAQAHVGAVQEATSLMLQRVEALEAEVSGLLGQLRTTAKQVQADLATLHGQVAEVGGLGTPVSAVAAPAGPAAPVAAEVVTTAADGTAADGTAADGTAADGTAAAAGAGVAAGASPSADAAPATAAPAPAVTSTPDPVAPELPLATDEPAADRSTDEAGARMVALTMIFDGIPRDRIDQHLAMNYDLPDHAALLDELYARQA